ncbi:hypothetical protein KY339_04875 [Candidatus Woesearchaeota archaeon]|nr:hypothetical protein [Candidatus Woesearchaeota archaeon]
MPTNCINNGMNNITMTMHNGPYNSHFHPGTLLMINYINNNVVVEDLYTEVSKRYYFDDIESYGSGNNGVWAVLPFHIPESATDISVAIQLAARNVNDYNGNVCCKWEGAGCVMSCKDADYIIYLNSDTALERDAHPPLNPTYFYSPSNTSPYIQTGTNTVGVYISNFENRRYGYNNVRIYSDPINYPENSSYVEVNYTYTPPIISGVIEVTAAKQFGGNWSTPKETNFSFPLVAEAVSDVFAHYAQIFSAKTRVKADTNSPPANEVFLSPAVRVTPTSVLIPASTIDASPAATNYIEVEDTFGEPRTISPNSTIEYGFYVNAYVGYGSVFWNQSAADQDALDRLAEILGEYIDINNLVIENITMTEVPSLWGPSLIEVRVWH